MEKGVCFATSDTRRFQRSKEEFRLSQFKRIATTCNRLIATVSNTLLHDIYECAK